MNATMCVAFSIVLVPSTFKILVKQAVTGIPDELTDLKNKLHDLASILQKNDRPAIQDRLSGLAL